MNTKIIRAAMLPMVSWGVFSFFFFSFSLWASTFHRAHGIGSGPAKKFFRKILLVNLICCKLHHLARVLRAPTIFCTIGPIPHLEPRNCKSKKIKIKKRLQRKPKLAVRLPANIAVT